MRKNHVVKSVVCLLLVFAFALFVPAAVSRPAYAKDGVNGYFDEKLWFKSFPSASCFDKLWVGDTVYFTNQWATFDDGGYSYKIHGIDMNIVSGNNVQIDERLGADYSGKTLRFIKPGKAQVKVKETHESGESREQTFSFTVIERPKDKPVKAKVKNPLGNLKIKIGERVQDIDNYITGEGGGDRAFYDLIDIENSNYGFYSDIGGYFDFPCLAGGYSEDNKTVKQFMSLGFDPYAYGGVENGLVGDGRISGPRNYEWETLSSLFISFAFRPGTVPMDIYTGAEFGKVKTKIGTLGNITIEEPVIKTNAPASVKAGSTLNFTTSLTNTALKNLKTAQYEDPKNYYSYDENGDITTDKQDKHNKWFKALTYEFFEDVADEEVNFLLSVTKSKIENVNPVAYKPSVTVIEGKDCVTQSKQDYGNTLSSSETLTFKKTGTVKLKVTYNQFATSPDLLYYADYYDSGNKIWHDRDVRYNPTATVTIQVTADGKPASGGQAGSQSGKPAGGASSEAQALPPIDSKDLVLENSETGITVGADEGVIPSGSVLTAKPSDYVLKDPAGKFAAFDLTLENGGVAVQPNGKVQVAIPIPDGFDKSRLTVYRVEESDDLTELPCAVAGDTVTFETDHFSVYVVAETGKQTAAAVAKAGKRSPLPWILGGAGVLLAAGCAFLLLWRFKFRKKKPAGETGEE